MNMQQPTSPMNPSEPQQAAASRRRVYVILAASLLVHGGLLLGAALSPAPPEDPNRSVRVPVSTWHMEQGTDPDQMSWTVDPRARWGLVKASKLEMTAER
jgi:hypothetical protein